MEKSLFERLDLKSQVRQDETFVVRIKIRFGARNFGGLEIPVLASVR